MAKGASYSPESIGPSFPSSFIYPKGLHSHPLEQFFQGRWPALFSDKRWWYIETTPDLSLFDLRWDFKMRVSIRTKLAGIVFLLITFMGIVGFLGISGLTQTEQE